MSTPKYRRRRPHEREQFAVPVNQPTKRPPPEVLPWYWHPERDGVKPAPEAIQRRLKELDPDLRFVFSPVHERYILWVRNPRIGHEGGAAAMLCRGWQLLQLWEDPHTHEPMPLDESLLLANVYAICGDKYPSAKQYWEQLTARAQARIDAANKSINEDRKALQRDYRSSWQISTAGRGNRFAMHHDGSLVPSPGEAAWRAETRKTRIPSEQLKQEEADREKMEYGT